MPRRVIALVVAAAGIPALAACGLATASSGHRHHARHARLTLESMHPLTVEGHRFHRRERVRVVARPLTGETVVRKVRAGRRGRFTVTFPTAGHGPCVRVTVAATGRRGSHAVLRGVMQPYCVVD